MYVAKTLLPNIDINVQELSANKDRLFLKNLDKIIIIDGVIDILKIIKQNGHRCAIVTNCNRIVAEKIVDRMGINSTIDFIISNNDCKNSKPHPEPYLNALKKYGINNNRAFIFEDSKTGITSGKSIYPKCLIGVETLYDNKELLISGCNISIKDYLNFDLDLLTKYNNVSIDKIKNYIKNSFIAQDNTELVNIIIDDNKLKGGYIGDVISITIVVRNNKTFDNENIECVLKLENKNETSLSAMATKLQLYEREYYFYESVSKYININIPKFYCLVKDDMLNNYGILMENLFKTGNYKLNLNLNENNIDISLKIIKKMSNMHVKFWNKDLTKNFIELQGSNSPMFLPFWKNFIDEKWGNFKNKWKNTLSTEDLLLGQSIVENFENIQISLSAKNLTIIHGDIKSPNIFYNVDKNNDPTFLDWQHILIGKGVQDLIFFVIESFDIKNIKILYPIFKNYYYKKLIEQGIKNYSYEEYEQDIKDAISYVPFYTAVWFGTVPYDDLIDKNFPFFFIQKLFYLLKIIFK
jgi:beta-phosphoglucomutase-like phosphatase (HAD superfamily)